MRRSLAFAALSWALTMTSFAAAQEAAPNAEDVKQAAAAFDKGRDSYRLENYGEAAEQFEAADGFAHSAAALRLAMLARKAAGQMDRAATHAALGLELYPDDATLAKEAQALLDEQASQLGKLSVSCDESCDLLLDNKIVHGQSATNRTLYVMPGSHTLRAAWSQNRNRSEKVKLEAGGTASAIFVAPPVPTTPVAEPEATPGDTSPEAEEKKGGWSPAVFWTGAGVTVAGAAASTFLGIRAINEPGRQAVIDGCSSTDCDLYRQGVQNQTIATVAIGATAAVGVFTIITGIWFTDWSGDDSSADAAQSAYTRRSFTLRPTFSIGDGATVGATGTF